MSAPLEACCPSDTARMNLDAALDRVAESLSGSITGRVRRSWPLAPLTTYRLGGPAALYVEPAGARDLELLGAALRGVGLEAGAIPVLPLGRGSNLVVSDDGIPGVVIRLGSRAAWIEPWGPPQPGLPEEGSRGATAGAATALPQLANWAARRGLEGMEFAVAIPGSVGGGLRMNAGAYGREIAECVAAVRVFSLDRLVLEVRSRSELGFAYRRSNLSEHDLVVDADFLLARGDTAAIRKRMDEYRRHRASTQPGAAQNAGSVFRNPPGDSAGRLIEAAGLKGCNKGGVAVSSLHANFFVAGPGALAQDVRDLVEHVRAAVYETSGVELEPEIRFVGAFNQQDAA
ncbi:MAG: UDP-N-acetylmuramate dehydrogenase [Actinomycetota bacterium]|nr:UDP-N-acetylmuramate dehydrogenase [Actinomycetota bacterium]